MRRVLLIHWNTDEAKERIAQLRASGHDAELYSDQGLKQVFDTPPDVFVIDLSRLPANGRAVAKLLRKKKSTSGVPIIFAARNGARASMASNIPNATYVAWDGIGRVLRSPNGTPPRPRTKPRSRSLAQKLGIRSDTRLALFGAPKDFDDLLGPLTDGARLLKSAHGATVSVLFVTVFANLKRRFRMATHGMAEDGSLWIVWPAEGSAVATDLNQDAVRGFGLGAGWAAEKETAIDHMWMAMRFSRKQGA